MSEITLDFGTTAQKRTEGEAIPVVLLALDQGRYDMARSLDELRALADANGMEAVAEVVQKRSVPEAATLLGEGKVAEARLVCQNLNARAAIFDGELTGSLNFDIDTGECIDLRAMQFRVEYTSLAESVKLQTAKTAPQKNEFKMPFSPKVDTCPGPCGGSFVLPLRFNKACKGTFVQAPHQTI